MMRRKPLLPALGLAALLPTLALLACGHDAAETEHRDPILVEVMEVNLSQAARKIDAVGTIESQREAVMASKVMGTVTEIRKAAGDPVRRGEVVVVVDHSDVAGQIGQAEGGLAQAKAAAVLAEANYRRFQALHERGAASQLELDQARYQHETARGAVVQAEGAVETASSYRRYAEIPAPFDGQVIDRMINVGDMAAPGRPLMRIEDPRRLRLHATLPETGFQFARPGTEVDVFVPAVSDQPVRGVVAEAVPSLDPATRSMLVKIELPEAPGFRSGLYARAVFDGEGRPALLVPQEAVQVRGGLTGVYVAEDGRVTFRFLTVRNVETDPVEVLSGLSAGDRIIVSPPATLEIGQPVEVRG